MKRNKKVYLLNSFVYSLFLPCLVILLCTSAVTLISGITSIQRNLEEDNSYIANAISTEIREDLEQARNIIERYANSYPSSGMHNASYSERDFSVVGVIIVMDDHGIVRDASIPSNSRVTTSTLRGWDLSRKINVARAIRSTKMQWSPISTSLLTGKPCVSLAYRVGSYVYLGEIDLTVFRREVKSHGSNAHRSILLIDKKGTVLAQVNSPVHDSQRNIGSLMPVAEGMKGKYGSYVLRLDGTSFAIKTTPVSLYDLFVVVGKDSGILRRHIVNLGMVVLATCLVLFAILYKVLPGRVRKILSPLEQLEATAKRLSDYATPVSLEPSDIVEIDSLVNIFKDMSSAISSREEILRERETKYRALFEQSMDGILVFQNGRCVDFNNRTIELLGLDINNMSEFLLDSLVDMALTVGDDSGNILVQALSKASMQLLQYCEISLLRSDKTTVLVEINVQTIPINDADFLQVVIRDITENRRLLAQREMADAANRAKAAFLANISHEIKTPINAIMGYAQLQMTLADQSAAHTSYSKAILNSSEHLLSLLADILEMSMIESGKLTLHLSEFRLDSLLDEVVSIFKWKAQEKGLVLSSSLSPVAPVTVYGDKGKVRQILINLVGNSIKYTDVGSVSIVGRFEVRHEDECHVEIDVVDTGAGISSADSCRIFDRFERGSDMRSSLTSKQEGTGLGLAISREYAKLMGGMVSLISSEEHKGSTFRLSFDARYLASKFGMTSDEICKIPPTVSASVINSLRAAVEIGDFAQVKTLINDMQVNCGVDTRALSKMASEYDAANLLKALTT